MDYEQLVTVMRRLSIEAGDKIMEIYGADDFEVKTKSDESPVTIADEAADKIISDGLRAVKFAEVVVVLLDAAIPFEQQDLRIADLAEREGRAVVVAVNKWDVEPEKQQKLRDLKEAFTRLLPQLKGAPLITVSAKTGKGLDRLHAAIARAHDIWNRRVTTAQLNRWLEGMVAAHPPPAPQGRRIKLKYMTQAKTRPPTFIVFASRKDALPESYVRYLINGLRESFDLPAVPIRVHLRAGKNPYVKSKRKGKGKG